MNPYVKLDISDKIGTIEFYHPQSNSLPSIILKKLADMIYSAGQKEEISVIVLKSGGDRTFCAGASFDELMKIENASQGKDFFSGFAHVINASRKCPKLIIGRVQGKAVGGGVGMASATDYCFATKFASIKLSELAVGIGPFVVGPAVDGCRFRPTGCTGGDAGKWRFGSAAGRCSADAHDASRGDECGVCEKGPVRTG